MKKIDFADPNEFKRLERDAYYGVLEIEKFPAAEYKYFDQLMTLGYRYRHSGLPKQIVQERKLDAYKEYVNTINILSSRLRYAKMCQDKILIENSTRCKIEKSAKTSEMLELALNYIETATGEIGFAKRNLNKLKRGKSDETNS